MSMRWRGFRATVLKLETSVAPHDVAERSVLLVRFVEVPSDERESG